MNTWKVILATIVIFGTGVLTGALATRFYTPYTARSHRPWVAGRPEGSSPGGMRLEFLRRIQRTLDLTPQQSESIDRILKQSQERTHKIMEPIVPQMHEELQRAKAEFRQVLTPAQQVRFDDALKQQQLFKEQHRWNSSGKAATNSI